MIARRTILAGGAGLLLAACDKVLEYAPAKRILFSGEDLQRRLHRVVTNRAALAPEYRADQRSPIFRANGTRDPDTPEYAAMVAERFAGWRLQVGGLVERPLALSLADLRAMPNRAQITRHDCVEGWSAIGKWQGPMLGNVLKLARIRQAARYVVFTCADVLGNRRYYESVDLVDAFHPQTILAWAMNDAPLDVAHGAPVRLRVERQLGYKHAKYLMRVDAVDSLARVGDGKGGYWEDVAAYDWYAGI